MKSPGHWLGLQTITKGIPASIPLLDIVFQHSQDLLLILPFVSQFLLAGSHSSLFQPLNPCFQDLLFLLALLHDNPNVGLHCLLEIEILFNKLSLELANFQSPPVGFASPQYAEQNLRLAVAVVTLSST